MYFVEGMYAVYMLYASYVLSLVGMLRLLYRLQMVAAYVNMHVGFVMYIQKEPFAKVRFPFPMCSGLGVSIMAYIL